MKALYGDILESFWGWVGGQACDGLMGLAGMRKRQEALMAHLPLFKNTPGVCPVNSENIMKFWKEIHFKFLLD